MDLKTTWKTPGTLVVDMNSQFKWGGTIVSFKGYFKAAGSFRFVIMRPTGNTGSFSVVSYYDIEVAAKGLLAYNTYKHDPIRVEAGDLLGFVATKAQVTYATVDCNGLTTQFTYTGGASISNGGTYSFSASQVCASFSIYARVISAEFDVVKIEGVSLSEWNVEDLQDFTIDTCLRYCLGTDNYQCQSVEFGSEFSGQCLTQNVLKEQAANYWDDKWKAYTHAYFVPKAGANQISTTITIDFTVNLYPQIVVAALPKITTTSIYIFTTFKFTGTGGLSAVSYFAQQIGTFYIGVWRIVKSKLTLIAKVRVYAGMVGKQYFSFGTTAIAFQTDDMLGFHYPESFHTESNGVGVLAYADTPSTLVTTAQLQSYYVISGTFDEAMQAGFSIKVPKPGPGKIACALQPVTTTITVPQPPPAPAPQPPPTPPTLPPAPVGGGGGGGGFLPPGEPIGPGFGFITPQAGGITMRLPATNAYLLTTFASKMTGRLSQLSFFTFMSGSFTLFIARPNPAQTGSFNIISTFTITVPAPSAVPGYVTFRFPNDKRPDIMTGELIGIDFPAGMGQGLLPVMYQNALQFGITSAQLTGYIQINLGVRPGQMITGGIAGNIYIPMFFTISEEPLSQLAWRFDISSLVGNLLKPNSPGAPSCLIGKLISFVAGPNDAPQSAVEFKGSIDSLIEFPPNFQLDFRYSISVHLSMYLTLFQSAVLFQYKDIYDGVGVFMGFLGLTFIVPARGKRPNPTADGVFVNRLRIGLWGWRDLLVTYDYHQKLAILRITNRNIVEQKRFAFSREIATQGTFTLGGCRTRKHYYKGRIGCMSMVGAAYSAANANLKPASCDHMPKPTPPRPPVCGVRPPLPPTRPTGCRPPFGFGGFKPPCAPPKGPPGGFGWGGGCRPRHPSPPRGHHGHHGHHRGHHGHHGRWKRGAAPAPPAAENQGDFICYIEASGLATMTHYVRVLCANTEVYTETVQEDAGGPSPIEVRAPADTVRDCDLINDGLACEVKSCTSRDCGDEMTTPPIKYSVTIASPLTISVEEGGDPGIIQLQVGALPSVITGDAEGEVVITATVTQEGTPFKCVHDNTVEKPQVSISYPVSIDGYSVCGFSITDMNFEDTWDMNVIAVPDWVKDGDATVTVTVVSKYVVGGTVTSEQEVGVVTVTVIDKDEPGVVCESRNDPHMKTFDGVKYDIFMFFEYLLYRNTRMAVQVHARFDVCPNQYHKAPACNCAVMIQAGDDVYVYDRCQIPKSNPATREILYLNGRMTTGFRIFKMDNGRTIQVHLPTGGYVQIIQDGAKFLNIKIYPSSLDFGNTEGLCGLYDGSKEGDLIQPDGNAYTGTERFRHTFGKMWEIDSANSMRFGFCPPDDFDFEEVPNILYCDCKAPEEMMCTHHHATNPCIPNKRGITVGDKTVQWTLYQGWSIDGSDVKETTAKSAFECKELCVADKKCKAIEFSTRGDMTVCKLKSAVKADAGEAWVASLDFDFFEFTEITADDVNKIKLKPGEEITDFLVSTAQQPEGCTEALPPDFNPPPVDPGITDQSVQLLPFPPGLSEPMVREHCTATVQNSATFDLCAGKIDIDITAEVEACVIDVKLTGNLDWGFTAADAVNQKCADQIIGTPDLWEDDGEGNMVPPVLLPANKPCPDNCKGHGECVEGVCECEEDWFGVNCGIPVPMPIPECSLPRPICDPRKDDCTVIEIDGDEFADVPGLVVLVTYITIKPTGTEKDAPIEVTPTFISTVKISITVEIKSGLHPTGIILQVSKDGGETLGPEVKILFPNTDCFECDPETAECLQKPNVCIIGETCVSAGTPNPDDPLQRCNPSISSTEYTVVPSTPTWPNVVIGNIGPVLDFRGVTIFGGPSFTGPGAVMEWRFFAKAIGTITFAIFRPDGDDPTKFVVIGMNTVPVLSPGLNVIKVPAELQIIVNTGDLMGVMFPQTFDADALGIIAIATEDDAEPEVPSDAMVPYFTVNMNTEDFDAPDIEITATIGTMNVYPAAMPSTVSGSIPLPVPSLTASAVAVKPALMIFPGLAFPAGDTIKGFSFFAVAKGDFFVSFWRVDPNDAKFYVLIGKILVTVKKPGKVDFMATPDTWVGVMPGDVMGIHFPDGATESPLSIFDSSDPGDVDPATLIPVLEGNLFDGEITVDFKAKLKPAKNVLRMPALTVITTIDISLAGAFPLDATTAGADIGNKGVNAELINVVFGEGPTASGGIVLTGGVDSFVNIPNTGSLDVKKSLTLSISVKVEGTGPILNFGADKPGISLEITAPGTLSFNLVSEGGISKGSVVATIEMDKWVLITATYDYDKGVATILLDGKKAGSAKVGSFYLATGFDVRLGATNFHKIGFKGGLANLQIFSKVVSSKEVMTLSLAAGSATAPTLESTPVITMEGDSFVCTIKTTLGSSVTFTIKWFIGSNLVDTITMPGTGADITLTLTPEMIGKLNIALGVRVEVTVAYTSNPTTISAPFTMPPVTPEFKIETSGPLVITEGDTTPVTITVTATAGPDDLCRLIKPSLKSCDIKLMAVLAEDVSKDFKCPNGDVIPQVVVQPEGTTSEEIELSFCGSIMTQENFETGVTINILAKDDGLIDADQTRDVVVQAMAMVNNKPQGLYFIGTIQVVVKDANTKLSTCSVFNDPHIRTFDGKKYDMMLQGEFTLFQHATRPYSVHTFVQPCTFGKPGATCNCAAAVRAVDDVIYFNSCETGALTAQLYLNGEMTPGTHVFSVKNGKSYVVILPTGTRVIIMLGAQSFLTVTIKAGINDKENVAGLCGTFDGDTSNDLTMPDGEVSKAEVDLKHPNTFSQSWQVLVATSLLGGICSSDPDEVTMTCECQFDTYTCGPYMRNNLCQPKNAEDILDQLIDEAMAPLGCEDPAEKPLVVLDPKYDPTPPKIKEKDLAKAQKKCAKVVEKLSIFETCSAIAEVNIAGKMADCAMDLILTGNDDYINNIIDVITEHCVDIVSTDTTKFEITPTGPVVPSFILNICPRDCNGKGTCAGGICKCDEGFMGPDCSITVGAVPEIVVEPVICDRSLGPCVEITISGTNLIPSPEAACAFTEMKIENGALVATENVEVVKAVPFGTTAIKCQIPGTSSYSIKISNFGTDFSASFMLLLQIDKRCFDVEYDAKKGLITLTRQPNTCFIDGECYMPLDPDPGNPLKACNPASSTDTFSEVGGSLTFPTVPIAAFPRPGKLELTIMLDMKFTADSLLTSFKLFAGNTGKMFLDVFRPGKKGLTLVHKVEVEITTAGPVLIELDASVQFLVKAGDVLGFHYEKGTGKEGGVIPFCDNAKGGLIAGLSKASLSSVFTAMMGDVDLNLDIEIKVKPVAGLKIMAALSPLTVPPPDKPMAFPPMPVTELSYTPDRKLIAFKGISFMNLAVTSSFKFYALTNGVFYVIYTAVVSGKLMILGNNKIFAPQAGEVTVNIDPSVRLIGAPGLTIGIAYDEDPTTKFGIIPVELLTKKPCCGLTSNMFYEVLKFDAHFSDIGKGDLPPIELDVKLTVALQPNPSTYFGPVPVIPISTDFAEVPGQDLYVFTDLKFHDHAHFVGFTFISLGAGDIYFGLWRLVDEKYTLVTMLKVQSFGAGKIMVLIRPQIVVQPGDMIGIHYPTYVKKQPGLVPFASKKKLCCGLTEDHLSGYLKLPIGADKITAQPKFKKPASGLLPAIQLLSIKGVWPSPPVPMGTFPVKSQRYLNIMMEPKIKIASKICGFKFIADEVGDAYLSIFRPDSTGTQVTRVGSIRVFVDSPGEHHVNVPLNLQIDAQPGDITGVHYHDASGGMGIIPYAQIDKTTGPSICCGARPSNMAPVFYQQLSEGDLPTDHTPKKIDISQDFQRAMPVRPMAYFDLPAPAAPDVVVGEFTGKSNPKLMVVKAPFTSKALVTGFTFYSLLEGRDIFLDILRPTSDTEVEVVCSYQHTTSATGFVTMALSTDAFCTAEVGDMWGVHYTDSRSGSIVPVEMTEDAPYELFNANTFAADAAVGATVTVKAAGKGNLAVYPSTIGACGDTVCLNGGWCDTDDGETFACKCPTAYTGNSCEKRVTCGDNPCKNEGECKYDRKTGSATCVCSTKYAGYFCEIKSPCAAKPCGPGEDCIPSPDGSSFTCE